MKQFSELISERLKLTKNTKIIKSNDDWVLCTPTGHLTDKDAEFVKKFKDRKIKKFDKRLYISTTIYLITVKEAIDFWGLDNIWKSSKEPGGFYKSHLQKLPEDINYNNISVKYVQDYIDKHDLDISDLKLYWINDNKKNNSF